MVVEEEDLEEEEASGEALDEALEEDEEVFDSVTVILVYQVKLILAYFFLWAFFSCS